LELRLANGPDATVKFFDAVFCQELGAKIAAGHAGIPVLSLSWMSNAKN